MLTCNSKKILRSFDLPDDDLARVQMWEKSTMAPRLLSRCPMRKNAQQWLMKNTGFTDTISKAATLQRGQILMRATVRKSKAIDLLRKEGAFESPPLRYLCRPTSVTKDVFSHLMEVMSLDGLLGFLELDNALGSAANPLGRLVKPTS